MHLFFLYFFLVVGFYGIGNINNFFKSIRNFSLYNLENSRFFQIRCNKEVGMDPRCIVHALIIILFTNGN